MDTKEKLARAESALRELLFRNPLRHDGQAYEHELAIWGLGANITRPVAADFGQESFKPEDVEDYARKKTESEEE